MAFFPMRVNDRNPVTTNHRETWGVGIPMEMQTFDEVWSVETSDDPVDLHLNFVSPTGEFFDIRIHNADTGRRYVTITLDANDPTNPAAFQSITLPARDFAQLNQAFNRITNHIFSDLHLISCQGCPKR